MKIEIEVLDFSELEKMTKAELIELREKIWNYRCDLEEFQHQITGHIAEKNI